MGALDFSTLMFVIEANSFSPLGISYPAIASGRRERGLACKFAKKFYNDIIERIIQ